MNVDFSKRNKLIAKCLLFIVIFVMSFSFLGNFSLAGSFDNCRTIEEIENKYNSIKDSWDSSLQKTAGSWAIEVYGAKVFSSAEDILSFRAHGPTSLERGVWNTVETVFNTTSSIGFLVVIIYFLIDLLEKTTHENFNIEHFFRSCIKLILGALLVLNGLPLLEGLLDFGSGILNLVGTSGLDNDQAVSTLRMSMNMIENNGEAKDTFNLIAIILDLLIPYIIMLGCNLYVKVVCYSRIIEIGLVGAFAPIGMADIMAEGTKGNGFRYLKKFLALALQGAIIMGILVIFENITNTLYSESTLDIMWKTCILALAMITMIGKSRSIADTVAGA